MKENVKNTSLSAIVSEKASLIQTLFVAGVVLYNIFQFIGQSKENTSSNKEIKEELVTIKKDISDIKNFHLFDTIRMNRIERSIMDLSSDIQDVNCKTTNLSRNYVLFVKDNVTKTDLLFKYIEGIDIQLKKN